MYLMITFSIHYMVGKCIRIENQFLNNPTIIIICMDIIYMHTYIYQYYLEKRKEMVILFSNIYLTLLASYLLTIEAFCVNCTWKIGPFLAG